jgi:hypothetical protein
LDSWAVHSEILSFKEKQKMKKYEAVPKAEVLKQPHIYKLLKWCIIWRVKILPIFSRNEIQKGISANITGTRILCRF